MITIPRCSPKRGEIRSCTPVHEIQHVHILKWFPPHQVAEPFSMTVFFVYKLCYYLFCIYIFIFLYRFTVHVFLID